MLWVAGVILVLLAGWYLWGPAGGNLASLNQSNFASQFTAQFDGGADGERVLLLLFPDLTNLLAGGFRSRASVETEPLKGPEGFCRLGTDPAHRLVSPEPFCPTSNSRPEGDTVLG